MTVPPSAEPDTPPTLEMLIRVCEEAQDALDSEGNLYCDAEERAALGWLAVALPALIEARDEMWTPCRWRLQSADVEDVRSPEIQMRGQRDGTYRYVVSTAFSNVLTRDGDWEWEPQPSSRTDDFIARSRFATFEEAKAVYVAAVSHPPESDR